MKVLKTLMLMCFCAVAAEVSAQGVVTLTFDDASKTQFEKAFPLMEKYNLTGTLYVSTGGVDTATKEEGGWSMTWSNVREMRFAGWDIGSHTVTHPFLTKLAYEDLVYELEESKAKIVEEVGMVPVSFASPFGDYNDDVLEQVIARYHSHANAWGPQKGINKLDDFSLNGIHRINIDSRQSSEDVCGRILQAAMKDQWLVLLFHGLSDDEPDEYQIATQEFEKILQCIDYLKRNGSIEVRTIADVTYEKIYPKGAVAREEGERCGLNQTALFLPNRVRLFNGDILCVEKEWSAYFLDTKTGLHKSCQSNNSIVAVTQLWEKRGYACVQELQ